MLTSQPSLSNQTSRPLPASSSQAWFLPPLYCLRVVGCLGKYILRARQLRVSFFLAALSRGGRVEVGEQEKGASLKVVVKLLYGPGQSLTQ